MRIADGWESVFSGVSVGVSLRVFAGMKKPNLFRLG